LAIARLGLGTSTHFLAYLQRKNSSQLNGSINSKNFLIVINWICFHLVFLLLLSRRANKRERDVGGDIYVFLGRMFFLQTQISFQDYRISMYDSL